MEITVVFISVLGETDRMKMTNGILGVLGMRICLQFICLAVKAGRLNFSRKGWKMLDFWKFRTYR